MTLCTYCGKRFEGPPGECPECKAMNTGTNGPDVGLDGDNAD